MKKFNSLKMFMIVFVGISILTYNAQSIEIYITDYSSPKYAVLWDSVAGENYVIHLFGNESPIVSGKQTHIFVVNQSISSGLCKSISDYLDKYNVKIVCDPVANIATLIVFSDSYISKDNLLLILSSIKSNGKINVFYVPYESEDYFELIDLWNNEDVMRKIKDELFLTFGEDRFREVFGIGQSLYDNGVIEVYADNFNQDDITLIFEIVRKYIPEHIRFTIRMYHFIPESLPAPLDVNSQQSYIEPSTSNTLVELGVILAFAVIVVSIFYKIRSIDHKL